MYILTHKIYLKKKLIKLWFLYETINQLIQLDQTGRPEDWSFILSRFRSMTFTKYHYSETGHLAIH
jgi:hypothetical protein